MSLCNKPAPRFFWGQTRDGGSVLRFRDDIPDSIVNEIKRILLDSVGLDTSIKIASIIQVLEQIENIHSLWLGPAYAFEAAAACSGQAVKVTESNKELLQAGFNHVWRSLQNRSPCYMVVENHTAVSVCFSARSTIKAAEAGLQTLEGYRGKG
jgi:hypothetical protein